MITDVHTAFQKFISSAQALNALKRRFDHCVSPASKIELFIAIEKQKKVVKAAKKTLDKLETELEAKLEA